VGIEVGDPICQNGGYLRAENITEHPTSCADCICPPEWDGVDCARGWAPGGMSLGRGRGGRAGVQESRT